ncbi:MAG: efflux RND transporter periplasmic adaptor subunit [Nitrospira sp.]|nr:efflux RND transporter periplasmic adaptor subunit [Nitrospira sp.]
MNAKTALCITMSCALAGFLAVRLWSQAASQPAVHEEPPEQATLVDTSEVSVGSITESIQAVGTLQAVASITVRPEISGVIRRIDFADGQSVERAAPLLELDQEELQAQAHQAAAQETIAEVTYERLKRLSGQMAIVPAQQLDEARLALQAAMANRVLYATRLKKSVIRAPFAGTVGLRRVSVGDYVQPGQDLVNLEDLRILHVDFKVPEVWLGRVRVGLPMTVRTEAFPEAVFEGQIAALDPRVDSVNRTVAVRALVPNAQGQLRTGLFATVRVVLGQDAQALLVPEEALVFQGEQSTVFRVEAQRVHVTPVVVGLRERGLAQIRTGLQAGDRVVRTGTHKLREGQAVAVP